LNNDAEELCRHFCNIRIHILEGKFADTLHYWI